MFSIIFIVTFTADSISADTQTLWQIKLSGTLISSDEAFTVEQDSGEKQIAGGNAMLGFGTAIEYQFNETIGFELGTVYAKTPDIDQDENGNTNNVGEGPGFNPTWLGVDFNITNSEQFHFYAGPRVALINFDNFKLTIDDQTTHYEVENKTAWGAAAGLNYQLENSYWSVHAEAMYFSADMEVSERNSCEKTNIDFNPIMLNVGISYQF